MFSTSLLSSLTIACDAISVDAPVVKVQPATKETRDIIPEIAMTLTSDTPFPPPPNIASIFWSAFESLTPSLFRSVGFSSSYFSIFPALLKNHPRLPRIGSTTTVICPSCLKKFA